MKNELTKREMELLTNIIQKGYDPPRWQYEMRIKPGTYKAHVTAIYDKLGVHNMIDAVVVVIREGFITP